MSADAGAEFFMTLPRNGISGPSIAVKFTSIYRSIPMRQFLAPLFLIPLMALPLAAAAQDRLITVTGEGLVAAVPDLAFVNLGVSQQAETAAAAMAAMTSSMTAVMDRLATAGIAPVDIQTGQLTLDPVYDNSTYDGTGTPKINGYIATTMLQVRVRDMAIVGQVLDAVVQDGANRLAGVTFDLANRGPALDEARRRAVADAQARAALFAQASGVALGALITLTEQSGYLNPMPMFDARMEGASGAVPVAGGEVSLQAMVTMVYAIAE